MRTYCNAHSVVISGVACSISGEDILIYSCSEHRWISNEIHYAEHKYIRICPSQLSSWRCHWLLSAAPLNQFVKSMRMVSKLFRLSSILFKYKWNTNFSLLWFKANGSCHNADWWESFDKKGWSKCPDSYPYINGLYRSKAQNALGDWIYLLEMASCCNNGTFKAECVEADWRDGLDG